jgi:PelA/Pel-15E family pectate lyase
MKTSLQWIAVGLGWLGCVACGESSDAPASALPPEAGSIAGSAAMVPDTAGTGQGGVAATDVADGMDDPTAAGGSEGVNAGGLDLDPGSTDGMPVSEGNAGGLAGAGGTAGMAAGGTEGMPAAGAGGSAGVDGAGGSTGTTITPIDCPVPEAVPVTVAWAQIAQQAADWYATPEALSIAENILYYRNGNGGWPKNIEMVDRTAPLDDESTIDNRATTTQIDFLARVYSATSCSRYGEPALDGIHYLLDAQYDNGGWPQIYPNPTDYHARITYNDDAMARVLTLLREVSRRAAPYAFADDALVASTADSVARGIDVILKTQIVIDGQKTGWCAQHDELTLAPAQARTYELPSLSGSEGANLMRFLMTIDNPSPEVRDAVVAAATWFASVQLSGIRVQAIDDATQETGEDRILVQDPAAPPLWARFYELGTNRPIFSSRCEVPECADDPFFMVRYSLAEIDNERRVGYSWYVSTPRAIMATTYPEWRARWIQ